MSVQMVLAEVLVVVQENLFALKLFLFWAYFFTWFTLCIFLIKILAYNKVNLAK